jgi:hypothetical protein
MRQVSADSSHRHDRSRKRVDGAHDGQVLADVADDAALRRATDGRLVLDVDVPVEIKAFQCFSK